MKKHLFKTVAAAFAMSLMLVVTGCGGNKTSVLEEYFQTEEMQAMIQESKDSLDGSGMSVEILAQGNSLIYEYTFEDGIFDETDMDTVKEQLASSLESETSTFEDIAANLNEELKVKDSSVIVRYLYNGEVFGETTFTENEAD